MKYMKSIKTSLLIIFICFCTFCSGYTMGSSFVFADSTTDEWLNVTTNEQLAEAFRYYCKSRNLVIEGSFADSLTKFTTKTFKGLCNTLGINMDTLQAEIKYQTDGNLGTRFLFSALSINAYNRIFAEFLQNNDLEVGDEANEQDNTIYSEMVFVDDLGIATKVYKSPVINGSILNYSIEYGEPYKLTGSDIYSNWANGATSFTFNIMNNQYVKNIVSGSGYVNGKLNRFVAVSGSVSIGTNLYIYESRDDVARGEGNFAFIYNTNTGRLYYGIYSVVYDNDTGNKIYENIYNYGEITNQQPVTSIIFLTTNNNVINNNIYEGDTIINNNGTTSEPDVPTPDPEPDYTPAEDWDIDLPDLSIPNWIISGKENKFPFDIPFNVMYALSLLQAEPEAPRLEGTLDFGFYEWEYDLDLSDFDTVAEICRNMEVLAFITGLMLMTRKLIWG